MLYGLDAALLLANIEVGDNSCGGKWTLLLARPQCDLIRKGYAVKARVTPQQKTEAQLQMLEDAAAIDANLLLNVGPKGDGSFPEEDIRALEEAGQRLQ